MGKWMFFSFTSQPLISKYLTRLSELESHAHPKIWLPSLSIALMFAPFSISNLEMK